jgi:hypothetical protein
MITVPSCEAYFSVGELPTLGTRKETFQNMKNFRQKIRFFLIEFDINTLLITTFCHGL